MIKEETAESCESSVTPKANNSIEWKAAESQLREQLAEKDKKLADL